MAYQTISLENKDEILYLGIGLNSQKSMVTFTQQTLQEISDALGEIEQQVKEKKGQGLVLFSHQPGQFAAGMDVSVIQALDSESQAVEGCEFGQNLFSRIEDLKVPSVCLVDGICLGGGLEMALSCDKILASDRSITKFGLPEVKLGVCPGFGGTYRLPRKIGLTNALDLILTGRMVDARKAKKIGLADFTMPVERLLEKAPLYLSKSKKEGPSNLKASIGKMAEDNFFGRKIIFQKSREKVLESSKGHYPAPLRILDLLEQGHFKSRESYLSMEAQAFGELSQTSQSKNLQHIFFLTDESKKLPEHLKSQSKNQQKSASKKIKKGAVIGAGTMGGGIAWLFAQNNQAPLMKDMNVAGLELGLKQSAKNFSALLKRKKISQDDFERKQRSIVPTLDFRGMEAVDLVIEAIVENMDIKKKAFAELEKHVQKDCLLTSNTSSLSITEMSTGLEDSTRFAGLHFFNPVNKMPLVEIIRHPDVSDETLASLYRWCLAVKKTPVIVGDGPGFLVNRILMPYLSEAAYLLEEGVSIESLDRAVLNFGMPMGPCRLLDEIGIDVIVKVGDILHKGLGERAKPAGLATSLVGKNILGKKNGKGFYLYDAHGKSEGVNPEVKELLTAEKKLDEKTLQMRVILPMINEAATILSEGIVDSADKVDLGAIYGIGFPPFRGGPLRYADQEGPDRILGALEKFAEEVSQERYSPSAYLKDLVTQKKKFYDL